MFLSKQFYLMTDINFQGRNCITIGRVSERFTNWRCVRSGRTSWTTFASILARTRRFTLHSSVFTTSFWDSSPFSALRPWSSDSWRVRIMSRRFARWTGSCVPFAIECATFGRWTRRFASTPSFPTFSTTPQPLFTHFVFRPGFEQDFDKGRTKSSKKFHFSHKCFEST